MKRILVSILLLTVACSKEKPKDFDKEYKDRVLLLYLASPKPNAQTACENSMKSAETCLGKSSGFPLSPYPLTERTLTMVISGTSTTITYSDYCKNLLAGTAFRDFTESARECYMNCNKEYWDIRNNTNVCSIDFSKQLSGISSGTTSCTNNCFKTTSNQ